MKTLSNYIEESVLDLDDQITSVEDELDRLLFDDVSLKDIMFGRLQSVTYYYTWGYTHYPNFAKYMKQLSKTYPIPPVTNVNGKKPNGGGAVINGLMSLFTTIIIPKGKSICDCIPIIQEAVNKDIPYETTEVQGRSNTKPFKLNVLVTTKTIGNIVYLKFTFDAHRFVVSFALNKNTPRVM